MFRGRVAGRAQRLCISPRLRAELPRNAKVDQIDAFSWRTHDVVGLDIAEDDGWLLRVQIGERLTHLNAQRDHLIGGHALGGRALHIIFQRLPLDKLRNDIPGVLIGERIVDLRQGWMIQERPKMELTLIGIRCIFHLLRREGL